MQKENSQDSENIRYQVDEQPPTPLTIGLGIQLATLCIAGVVLGPAIVVNAAGGDQAYLLWAVFGAIFVSGISSVIQAVRFGRIGAGYVLVMGTSGAFIAVSVAAIAQGGPAMMATLVIVSSLFQFLLGWHLSLFRRILTPTVAGTVIMLIPVTVMPIIFDMLSQVPEGAPANSASISALVTAVAIGAIALKAKGMLRLWAPVIGIVVGSFVAIYYGIYDFSTFKSAAWFGLPEGGWPGFDLSFGPVFWSLLPAFIFVTLVGAIETVGDGVAIQRVSWRRARAIDFRAVQGAVNADGLGNFLSGLIGTVPNTTYSTSVSVTALTGVAARGIGVALGAVFIVLAFFPKILAIIIAIPGPVAAAYMTVLLGLLFVVGMRVVIQDGADYRKSLIVGVAFWVGVGFQNGLIFPEIAQDFAGGILENGMTAGGLTAIILSLFVEFTNPRRHRLSVPFDTNSLPEIRNFLETFASKFRWGEAAKDRLTAVAEEALLTLENQMEDADTKLSERHLLLTIQREGDKAVMEVISAPSMENIEDRIALVGGYTDEATDSREVSLRILRHYASSVHHQQYHDTDVITMSVDVASISK